MEDDTEPVSISALEHWSYCPRQCCLIHAEQAFAENIHTLRGQAVHARTDEPGVETRPGLRVVRAMPLWCDRLGLIGKSDVVEFLPDGTPYPVEYKHGKKREKLHDDIQLAAQALCLEEMEGRGDIASLIARADGAGFVAPIAGTLSCSHLARRYGKLSAVFAEVRANRCAPQQ